MRFILEAVFEVCTTRPPGRISPRLPTWAPTGSSPWSPIRSLINKTSRPRRSAVYCRVLACSKVTLMSSAIRYQTSREMATWRSARYYAWPIRFWGRPLPNLPIPRISHSPNTRKTIWIISNLKPVLVKSIHSTSVLYSSSAFVARFRGTW
jgi:hypothetical protein